MSRSINISQSVDPNTLVLDIHENYRTRTSVLLSRAEAIALCDQLRVLLGDSPTVPIPDAKLAVFPTPEAQPMKVQIVQK